MDAWADTDFKRDCIRLSEADLESTTPISGLSFIRANVAPWKDVVITKEACLSRYAKSAGPADFMSFESGRKTSLARPLKEHYFHSQRLLHLIYYPVNLRERVEHIGKGIDQDILFGYPVL